jgi:hypothetical protein
MFIGILNLFLFYLKNLCFSTPRLTTKVEIVSFYLNLTQTNSAKPHRFIFILISN